MFKTAIFGFTLFLGALQLPLAAQENTPKELIQYVRDAKKAGIKDAQIRQNAMQAGWAEQDVKSAMNSPQSDQAKPANETSPAGTSPAAMAAPATTPPATEAPATAPAETPAPATSAAVQQSTPSSAPAAGAVKPDVINRGVPDEYRIGEGDVLQVNVWGEPTASVNNMVVRPDGKITLPLVKDISVAGFTPAEAEKSITEQLSKQIKAAVVTVIVNQINSKKIFVVGGGVKKEGPINFTYRMTVMQALSEAGGLTDYAKRKKIYVLRNENGRQYQLKFDYDAVLKGEHMETNIPLIAGDTLVVPNH